MSAHDVQREIDVTSNLMSMELDCRFVTCFFGRHFFFA